MMCFGQVVALVCLPTLERGGVQGAGTTAKGLRRLGSASGGVLGPGTVEEDAEELMKPRSGGVFGAGT